MINKRLTSIVTAIILGTMAFLGTSTEAYATGTEITQAEKDMFTQMTNLVNRATTLLNKQGHTIAELQSLDSEITTFMESNDGMLYDYVDAEDYLMSAKVHIANEIHLVTELQKLVDSTNSTTAFQNVSEGISLVNAMYTDLPSESVKNVNTKFNALVLKGYPLCNETQQGALFMTVLVLVNDGEFTKAQGLAFSNATGDAENIEIMTSTLDNMPQADKQTLETGVRIEFEDTTTPPDSLILTLDKNAIQQDTIKANKGNAFDQTINFAVESTKDYSVCIAETSVVTKNGLEYQSNATGSGAGLLSAHVDKSTFVGTKQFKDLQCNQFISLYEGVAGNDTLTMTLKLNANRKLNTSDVYKVMLKLEVTQKGV